MSSTRLLVLGLLHEQPRHGYEINQMISAGALEQWTAVKSGSVYHALTKLEAEELIETHSEERVGDRVRHLYAITPAGREVLRDLVRSTLAVPPHAVRSDFPLALRWAELLDRREILGLLDSCAEAIEKERRLTALGRQAKAAMSPLAQAVFDNTEAHLAADAKLLDQIRTALSSSGRE
ncbi:PadR family transcriptional regulator [Kibdelosporangium persicum]|uniref:DNA-binding transcriptional regulator, PadR family n=1 Tax=Kibdelosporangium persicum TaxID=2698649 RepID=A0ABX2F3D8_9PSEU|nr:PadR family transcriptional regulator [Kibdelosporangium persicum]NRN65654.1 DNA-binding transcriptional regulator, PadR family [Kibdelosporangium persicum]